jgi:hypothetical protein
MAVDLEGTMANAVRLVALVPLILSVCFFGVAKLCRNRRPVWLHDVMTWFAVIFFGIGTYLFAASFT